jgi:hypothetical protein
VKHFLAAPLWGLRLALPQTLDKVGQGQNTRLLRTFRNHGCKKFNRTGPRLLSNHLTALKVATDLVDRDVHLVKVVRPFVEVIKLFLYSLLTLQLNK